MKKNLTKVLKKKVKQSQPPSSNKRTKVPVKSSKPNVDYKLEWQGMPGFEQEDLQPFKAIIVNFQSAEDMHKFAKLVGQLITAQTRFIWYPEVSDVQYMDKRWVDKKGNSPLVVSHRRKKK